jgi:hypothetical protein
MARLGNTRSLFPYDPGAFLPKWPIGCAETHDRKVHYQKSRGAREEP